MYIYFDKQGVIKEIINDGYLRQGSDGADVLYFYFENDEMYDSVWLTIKRADGVLSEEKHLSEIVNKEIPYNKNRDLKYFKDYKEYKFYYYKLTSEDLVASGLAYASVRAVDTISHTTTAKGKITFNVEENVIKEDHEIKQSQYDYLIQKFSELFAKVEYTRETVETDGDVIQVMSPDIFYNFTGELTSLTLEFAPAIEGRENEYKGQFFIGDNEVTVVFPENVVWVGDEEIEFETKKLYQFSILDNIGILLAV